MICHGYQFGCCCERCLDRAARHVVFSAAGSDTPADDAKRESAEYFETPWRFDKQTPPQPLGGT